MGGSSYQWRRLTGPEREEVLIDRKRKRSPWHSPPHRATDGRQRYHLTAACFEHESHMGYSLDRMDDFSSELLDCMGEADSEVFAWALLPNHYHCLIETGDVMELLQRIGDLHGRNAFRWNGEEDSRGRKVFCGAVEREIRSDRHFWSTMNYVLNNPVRHGYVAKWSDWPWSNAEDYLQTMGRARAEAIWREYPVRDYGAGWDDPSL